MCWLQEAFLFLLSVSSRWHSEETFVKSNCGIPLIKGDSVIGGDFTRNLEFIQT